MAPAADRRTVYEGADEGSLSFVYKFVAATAGNLSQGTLYVLKLDGALGSSTTGTWLQVPNGTPTECSSTTALAQGLGATNFSGVEDIEIGPHDGKIYFTSKSNSRVYRFQDAATGNTISAFEEFIGGQNYPINYGTGTASEAWSSGNDNLTFDSYGNLYVLQDGGRNHIWLVKPCHTQANPAVELFMVTPAGSEPTGMTLSPDERFMFVSIQGPDNTNTLATTDAAGQPVVFNKSTTLVIARKSELGLPTSAATKADKSVQLALYPNPASQQLTVELSHERAETAQLRVLNNLGQLVWEQQAALSKGANRLQVPVSQLPAGHYQLLLRTATSATTRAFIKQ